MNFMSKTRCKFNGDVTNNIRQNVKISSNNYESMSNNGNSSSENLISIQSAQTTSNTNNNDNNNNKQPIPINTNINTDINNMNNIPTPPLLTPEPQTNQTIINDPVCHEIYTMIRDNTMYN
eukprot:517215_1